VSGVWQRKRRKTEKEKEKVKKIILIRAEMTQQTKVVLLVASVLNLERNGPEIKGSIVRTY
jgi:hypothetical protein